MKYFTEFKMNELTQTSTPGTKAGSVTNLKYREYTLTKELKDFTFYRGSKTITLPKGTVVTNLPGGYFAFHKTLVAEFSKKNSGRNVYWDDKCGLMVQAQPASLRKIEDNSKVTKKTK